MWTVEKRKRTSRETSVGNSCGLSTTGIGSLCALFRHSRIIPTLGVGIKSVVRRSPPQSGRGIRGRHRATILVRSVPPDTLVNLGAIQPRSFGCGVFWRPPIKWIRSGPIYSFQKHGVSFARIKSVVRRSLRSNRRVFADDTMATILVRCAPPGTLVNLGAIHPRSSFCESWSGVFWRPPISTS